MLRRLWTMSWCRTPVSAMSMRINTLNTSSSLSGLLGFAEVCKDTPLPSCLFHLRLLPPCISPPSRLCCDVLQQWQRERRTSGSLASTIGWTWANHCWRSVAVSVHCRQLVGGGFSTLDHIGSAHGRACWIYSFRIRLLHFYYRVYPYCQQHTQGKGSQRCTLSNSHTHKPTYMPVNRSACLLALSV